MLCRNPYIRDPTGKILVRGRDMGFNPTDGLPFPCGQCLPCRINKRRVWTLRLMLESYYHEKASFVTLTYDDSHLPLSPDNGLPVLQKRDCQLWLKRLRKFFTGREIRYYLAGEYGTKTHRPHYHAILFGISPEELDSEFVIYGGKSGGTKGIEKRNTTLSRTWCKGLVHVGEVTRESVQYCAGYVTKKFVKKDSGYEPEFSLMSRRPGIGARAITEIAATLQLYNLQERTERQLRIDGSKWPLGRYLQTKLAEELGITFNTETYIQELKTFWAETRSRRLPFLESLIQQHDGQYQRIKARDLIFNQRSLI